MERFQPERPGDEPEPRFRLLRPEDDLIEEPPSEDDITPGQVSPNVRLPQFFYRWYKPVVIEGQGLAAGTELGYVELVGWWKRLTTDPPLRLIDVFTVTTFAARLRKATYRRGALGIERPLSPHRVALLLRNLRSLLGRIGPEREPNKPTAALIDKPPPVPVQGVESDPKSGFNLETARRIVAAAQWIDRPRLEGISPNAFWRGLLAWYYISGLRRGSLLGVEWGMLTAERDHWLLKVPARIVEKTGKPKDLAIPRWAYAAVARWPRSQPLIFVWPHDVDHLNDCHYKLQSLAGIPDEHQLSIQAWRRTHALAMGDAGLHLAEKLAQTALDHGDASTTRQFYANFENRVRLKLPRLWDESEDLPLPESFSGQRLLF